MLVDYGVKGVAHRSYIFTGCYRLLLVTAPFPIYYIIRVSRPAGHSLEPGISMVCPPLNFFQTWLNLVIHTMYYVPYRHP